MKILKELRIRNLLKSLEKEGLDKKIDADY